MTAADFDGWAWFQSETAGAAQSLTRESLAEKDELPGMAARCFRDGDGEQLITHLRRITVERCLAPGVSDSILRHLEGQRHLVRYLEMLIAKGRAGYPVQRNSSQGDDT